MTHHRYRPSTVHRGAFACANAPCPSITYDPENNKTLNCPSLLNGKPVSDTPPGSPKAPNDTPCGPVRVRRRGRR